MSEGVRGGPAEDPRLRTVKLVLHNYWRSSASHRVRIALNLKQQAFDYIAVNLVGNEQLAETYRGRNSMAQLPTLEITEDDGTVRSIPPRGACLTACDEVKEYFRAQ